MFVLMLGFKLKFGNIYKYFGANVFTEDDRVKFKDPTPKAKSSELQKSEVKSKTIAAIVIIIVMIIVSIVVAKKHKRFRKEDEEILTNDPNTAHSFFSKIRSTDLGCNALIAAEIDRLSASE